MSMLSKSISKYIFFFFISFGSSYAFSNQIVLNCKLERIGTPQNHKGVIQENTKEQIFIFSDTPTFMISFNPTKYDALKSEFGKDWTKKANELYQEGILDRKTVRESDEAYVKMVKKRLDIKGPVLGSESVFYEEIDGSATTRRYSYKKSNGELAIYVGWERASPDSRYFYSCNALTD